MSMEGSANTWAQVIDLARHLEDAARHDQVPPSEGARLVRLVLAFQTEVVGSPVRHGGSAGTRTPEAGPVAPSPEGAAPHRGEP